MGWITGNPENKMKCEKQPTDRLTDQPTLKNSAFRGGKQGGTRLTYLGIDNRLLTVHRDDGGENVKMNEWINK